jgi:hypothetical protein
MLRVADDDVRDAELSARLNRARDAGDIVEMWQCARKLVALDQRRSKLIASGLGDNSRDPDRCH